MRLYDAGVDGSERNPMKLHGRKITAALPAKEPLRHSLLVNALDDPLDTGESDHIRGHVFQGNPGIASNGSKTVPTGLSPKAFNHAGIFPAFDVRPGKPCPRRSDIRGLHLDVVVDEVRNIADQISRASSREGGQVMDEIWEDAVRHDGVLLEVCGTEIDGQASQGHRNDEWESGGETLEVEPNSMFRIHVPSIHSRRIIFRDEVVVDGIRLHLRVDTELPLVKVERGDP